jgi:putative hydrolase of the HAD superfamily
MIKSIIFDLGRVIVPFDFRRGYAQLEELSGIPAHDIPHRIRATDLVDRFECGQLEPREFVDQFAAQLDLRIGYEDFCGIWNSIFLPETLIPESLLASLAKRYRLVLLSNTNRIHFEGIQPNYPILRHFHARILSYEVGVMKPGAEIYRRAVAAAGCLPEECFFTDDMAENVEAALREGIDAVQFHSAAQIEQELRERGVVL